jgi:hypothetical protein
MSRIKLILPGIKVLIVAVVVIFSIFLACGDALAMFCSKCGKDIADDSVFCKYCGFKMGGGQGNSGGVDRTKLGKDLLDASSKGDVGKVRSLVAAGADINVRDKNGDSALEHAADKGCLDIVKFLVEKGAEVNNYNVDNWTPLMSSSNRGYFEVVKFLMENGANINFAARFGKLGERTPLMQAAFCGHEEIVKLLVEKGADAGYPNKKGETALSLAAARGNKNIVSFLEGGADDSFGKTFGPVDPDKLESVYEKFGDIFLAFKNGTVEKITSGGCCGFPVLSPDKKFLCFVRTFPGVIVEMPCGEVEVTNLYAATSNAVKSVDLKSRIVKFLTDGISLRLIYSGNYSGHFISARHKYDGQDGARDVYCLMSPDGEEVREISVEFADVEKEFFNGK